MLPLARQCSSRSRTSARSSKQQQRDCREPGSKEDSDHAEQGDRIKNKQAEPEHEGDDDRKLPPSHIADHARSGGPAAREVYMIAGLDSSFDRPTPAQAAAAYAAGVRAWGGYFGLRPRSELGLATLWDQADFDVIRNAGMTPIGFCSGWDDPVAIRARAAAWGILPCVDVERLIRDDGPWVDPWLAASRAGLYGNASVHFETGQPVGRGAAFNIVSGYFGYDPQKTWEPWLTDRPSAPTGWQWQGGHWEVGLEVDSNWPDGWLRGVEMCVAGCE